MPRVSILLTCYNHIAYLPTAVDSIRSQTFSDYEIIAIDDGSNDGTREWLTKNLTEHKLIFTETNLGTYGALNRALEEATGELIAVFNDDDVWLPKKLEAQIALLDANPKVGLVHTDGYFIDGKGDRQEGTPLGFEFPRFETGDVALGLVYMNKIIASAALARRACFDEVGVFNPEYFGSGDWEMWCRIADKWLVGFVNEPLTLYRVHGANASHKLERIWRDDEKLRTWLIPRLEGYKERFPAPELNRAIAHNYAALGTVQTLNGNASGGRASYGRSIKAQPSRLKSYLRWAATFLPKSAFRKLL